MLGKSGIDWSKAPEGATHVLKSIVGSLDGLGIWYQKDKHCWIVYTTSPWTGDNLSWYHSWNQGIPKDNFISKEEDLRMSKEGANIKQVKCIADLEVGMFVKSNATLFIVHKDSVYGRIWYATDNSLGTYLLKPHEFKSLKSWSYTYKGEYTPIIHESEQDERLKELEETIATAQRQVKEIREGKE